MSAYVTRNPADLEDVVTTVDLADAPAFVDAARRARAAQKEWARVPAPVRGRVIAQVGRLVEDNKQALARLVTREVGKPYAEALGEVQEVVDTCDFFLGEGRRLYGMTVPSEMPDKQLFTFRVPVGVAAIITAANFPAAVPSWYLVPALLCGNAVVWKPAETSAGVALALLALFRQGGVPEGVLDVVLADGETTYAGPRPRWTRDWSTRSASRVVGGGAPDRRARRPSPAERLPRAGRQEPHGRHARRGSRPGGGGCPVRGIRYVRPAVHVPRHGLGTPRHRRRRSRRSSSPPLRTRSWATPLRTSSTARCCRRAISSARAEPGMVADHHSVHGSRGRPYHERQSPQGLRGGPGPRCLRPSDDRGRRATRRRLYDTETFGPLVGLGVFGDARRGDRVVQRPRLRALRGDLHPGPATALRFRAGVSSGMLSINNSTSGAEAHLPFGGNGRSRQRFPAVGRLGARPVHQMAGGELGLLRARLQKAQMDVIELPYDPAFRL